jgi:predicted fused transcriptional regulator/phosphomethylpyrimidine kinase
MTQLAADAFRPLGDADAIANDFVVPYYLDDLKPRISVARVDGRLYAFDDLCTCSREPAIGWPAHVAEQLYLSVRTVDSHRAHVMRKLNLRTRAEMVLYALANGLVGTT